MVELAPGARITVRQPNVRTRFIFTEGPKGDKGDPGDVPGTRQIATGTGLTGGGDLSADRTLAVAFGTTNTTVARGNRGLPAGGATGQALVKASGTDYDVTWGSGGSGAGGLIAYTIYNPTTPVTYSVGTTVSDVDATNLSITFTATSTSVMVTLEATAARSGTGAGAGYWSLRNGTTNIPGSSRAVIGTVVAASALHRARTAIRITGLTVGVSYTYKWAFRNTGSSNSQILVGNTGGDEFSGTEDYGPATMEVWAA